MLCSTRRQLIMTYNTNGAESAVGKPQRTGTKRPYRIILTAFAAVS